MCKLFIAYKYSRDILSKIKLKMDKISNNKYNFKRATSKIKDFKKKMISGELKELEW